ncbi:MAG TPA: prolipoprotein diacylglyceryl transferase [Phototrophicaceae bacterium]|nr:prolipoprotein diacylglyceryl transferase [Phototrophicaceae bacterium]
MPVCKSEAKLGLKLVIDAYGIHIGPLYIHFYALILLTGLLAATWLTSRRAERAGYSSDMVWDALTWVFIPGLIGARLYHVLTPSPDSGLTTLYYLQNPLQIFAIWNGGLGIYGAVLGGAIGLYFYTRRHHLPLLRLLDLVAPTILLAQAIGRWGNFVNQELYGAPTNLPWAIYIPPDKRLPGYENYAYYHPLFLYESLMNLFCMALLLWIERRFKSILRAGDIMLMYLMLYAVVRFLLDFVRLDSNGIGPLTTAQWVSTTIFVVAGIVLVGRHRLQRAPEVQPPAAPQSSPTAEQK